VDGAVVAGLCVGVCLALIAIIVIAPSRRVRDEPPVDEAVQSRILLGDDPDEIAADADAAERDALAERPDPPVSLPRRGSESA
jgi:hypothetical protein